ncbi:MBL fold metallo-hydrolase [Sediminibacillus albus]|uniref:Phosphoribosyl 1,2-cyclic phosphate phosphodiesterase n=1 Tax=Sediminibacillus albus TaxID=407036 RepID=A0A1G8YA52_9BACI|nr:MBL fold metallo-hydrolase [Sediminibacillus albus]SDJ99115.1 phosphoribosyl 1,2-cyclic phosphate phosphodiesterase [Sediminibacillus albus]
MKIHLLGSAAAEGVPAIFCRCELCQKAKNLGGKDIRTRTSALVDDNLKIDFPPDTFMHVLREGDKISEFEHLIVTHTHHDHFYPEDIRMRTPGFARNYGDVLNIYGNEKVVERCRETLANELDCFNIAPLQAFTTYEIGGKLITPLKADHKPDEHSFIYFIEKDGKTCLYGHDTGVFPTETFNWLANRIVDIAILDCTNGLIDRKTIHMNIEAVKDTKAKLAEIGVIHENSKVVATHFSHNCGLLHKDLEKLLVPFGIDVAYDGMELTI